MPSWVLDGTEELKEASANEADGVVNLDICDVLAVSDSVEAGVTTGLKAADESVLV